jgi:glycosyltransferase involved in cell wall biosynthesis
MKNNNKYKILIMQTQYERAGAQKNALMQAAYFHKNGYDVIYCFLYDKFSMSDELNSLPFRVVNMEAKLTGESRLRGVLRFLLGIRRLYQLIRREQIQAVETLTHYSNIIGIVVAWVAGVRVRISSQRNSLLDLPTWFWRLDGWIVNSKLVDCMIVVSEQTKRFCIESEGMSPQKIILIPNGINPNEYKRSKWDKNQIIDIKNSLGIPRQALVVTTIARLHSQKGHTYLIKAAKEIVKNSPNTIFLFVGDGEEKEGITNQISNSGLENNIYLLGIRKDIPELLAISDLFVLPSLYEGMSNVILEAMAASLPVIASDVDGVREVVVHKETGYIVPKADPDALEKSINSLLENEDLRIKMGKMGYERILSAFSDQVMCEKYESVLKSYLDKKYA